MSISNSYGENPTLVRLAIVLGLAVILAAVLLSPQVSLVTAGIVGFVLYVFYLFYRLVIAVETIAKKM